MRTNFEKNLFTDIAQRNRRSPSVKTNSTAIFRLRFRAHQQAEACTPNEYPSAVT
jgi:hypothetical protein